MPRMDWAALTKMSLGTFGEYFAKMELTSYGLDVYTSEVDDKGIDFVCLKGKRLFKIQVKSVRKSECGSGTLNLQKNCFDIFDDDLYLLLLLFRQDRLPEPYLIPASAWRQKTELFRYYPHDTPGQTSLPEYALNLSKKSAGLLKEFRLDRILTAF